MVRDLLFRLTARQDLKDLYDYIEQDSPAAAARYVDEVIAFCTRLSEWPERGLRRDDLASGLRVLGFRKRASIVFRVTDTDVEVIRVLYGGRDLDRAFGGKEN